mmetsp:Transcript_114732/g.244803  ORF Transcript_114732/g.244803 Transcript_114732/m.244803 type:complete len:218 (-) Transcript_114732:188-841(-)
MVHQQFNLNAESTFQRSPKWSFGSSGDLRPNAKSTPGPGQYDLPTTLVGNVTIQGRHGIGRPSSAPPGPGAYKVDKIDNAPKWGFGGDSRFPAAKRSGTPGPGSYKIPTSLKGKDVSIVSRTELIRPRTASIGPTTYNPSYEPSSLLRSAPKIGFAASSRGRPVLRNSPGPGSYDLPTTLIGNIAMKSPSAYSIKGRYKPPRGHETPGPQCAGTVFH